MRKNSTTINEVARLALDITRDEYALCAYVQYRQADRRVKAGWCADPKHELADFVGITRPGLYKMIDRLCGKDLLHIDAGSGHLQVTGKWIDTENDKKSVNKVYTDKKQSLQRSVNKVDTDCKLSLQHSVNLVTSNIEVEYDNKKEERECSKNNARREIENLLTLNTEDQKSPSPNSAPPPSRLETWLSSLPEDHTVRAGFTMGHKIPSAFFEDYVTRFPAIARTQPEKYQNKSGLVGHFLNWSRIQFQNESKKQNNGSQKFTFDLNKSLSEADEWLAQHNREMAAERAMRGQ